MRRSLLPTKKRGPSAQRILQSPPPLLATRGRNSQSFRVTAVIFPRGVSEYRSTSPSVEHQNAVSVFSDRRTLLTQQVRPRLCSALELLPVVNDHTQFDSLPSIAGIAAPRSGDIAQHMVCRLPHTQRRCSSASGQSMGIDLDSTQQSCRAP